MSSTELYKIVAFVSGKLPQSRIHEIEDIIIKNPDALETIHEMARLQKVIGKERDLSEYLSEQKQRLFERIASAVVRV